MSSNTYPELHIAAGASSSSSSTTSSSSQQPSAASAPEISSQRAPSPANITAFNPQFAAHESSAALRSHMSWATEVLTSSSQLSCPCHLMSEMSDWVIVSAKSMPVKSLAVPFHNQDDFPTEGPCASLLTAKLLETLPGPFSLSDKAYQEITPKIDGSPEDEALEPLAGRQRSNKPMTRDHQYEQELAEESKAKSLDERCPDEQSPELVSETQGSKEQPVVQIEHEEPRDDATILNDAVPDSTNESILAKNDLAGEPSTCDGRLSSGSPACRSPCRSDQQIPREFRKTRGFLISDTHNHSFRNPQGHYDFVVCLGDHTTRSTRQEFEKFIWQILEIDTDHIFLLFGNHEYSTDGNLPEAKYPSFPAARLQYGEGLLKRDYALQLCRENAIVLLDEGRHVFHLNNGTTATIYASPYTPQRKRSPYIGYRYKRRENGQFGHSL